MTNIDATPQNVDFEEIGAELESVTGGERTYGISPNGTPWQIDPNKPVPSGFGEFIRRTT
ncbi:MAG: hypothetical protein QM831_29305 [Kofleriaceae bacterium]